MTEKYIDLQDKIWEGSDAAFTSTGYVLAWLDAHPDQVPGRTITRSEYRDTLNGAVKVSGYGDDWERGFNTGLVVAGTKVVPDPEPTNAEKWQSLYMEWMNNSNVEFGDFMQEKIGGPPELQNVGQDAGVKATGGRR